MRTILESLARGDPSVAEAEAPPEGYTTTEAGRFDAARRHPWGVPEAVLADGKPADAVAEVAIPALEATGPAPVTPVDAETADPVRAALPGDAEPDVHGTSGVPHATTAGDEPPSLSARVVVTAGTNDGSVAGEPAAVAGIMGPTAERTEDVGVAGRHGLLDVSIPSEMSPSPGSSSRTSSAHSSRRGTATAARAGPCSWGCSSPVGSSRSSTLTLASASSPAPAPLAELVAGAIAAAHPT